MNYLVSCDVRPPNAMNILGLRIVSMILGHEPLSPNAMKLRVVDEIKDSES